ncbi:hypothetical protein MAC_00592 [Metarhizium acridum CQMa 102]|uniref:DUF676 domain-containing protein n=1 Tax=Metarhizium acridum (strain CQMa 102) TaxID=655827 RepID=E9DSJ4_METAQ|nr:uncharacterized protein MAC_00592 [Metarhizium acridum CQMa 102]EFY93354.1 hypothetical protein MAC_00592 [Metarhizium acridum CQMa 102]
MKKTLLLCFIHGFKGGESTFGDDYEFTKHLRDIVAQKLPKVDVRVLVYPKYETRGDLGECVSRFRSWFVFSTIPGPFSIVVMSLVAGTCRPMLEDKVIDMEVASGTASPTVDPSVRTILVGHSMGGIVAAELLIALASEKPIYSEDGIRKSDGERPAFNAFMFPYVQGVLAFDTPYLGISPGVIAEGWTWASSHLEFVGCLARAEELKKRVGFVVRLHEELGVGFANLYTRLGKGASSKKISMAGTVLGKDRTFCNLPKTMNAGDWIEAVNDEAGDETVAHMTMFEPKENPGYEKLTHDAAGLIAQWSRNDWYENSTETTTPERVQSAEVDEKGKGAEKEEEERETTEQIAPNS